MVTARALISRDPLSPFSIESVQIDDPRSDEILVRMRATGICHTDLVARAAGSRTRPVLLGHEGAGVVETVGSRVTGIRPGDHVVLTYRRCGACANCAQGRPAYCHRGGVLNQFGTRADGSPRVTSGSGPVADGFFGQSSFAEMALTTQDNTIVVDRDVDLAVAAPLGCSVQTGAGAVMNVLRPEPSDSFVVHGAGGVGMAAVLAAVATGVGTICVVETSGARRALALDLGATHVFDPADVDVVEALRDVTGGGVTHALDTTGVADVVADAIAALGFGGTLVTVGLGKGTVRLDLLDTVIAGKTVRGCLEGDSIPEQFVPVLTALLRDGRLPVDRLVSSYHWRDIDAAVDDHRDGKTVKPVLLWE
ncbi:aryl-alcohol dehydrogenase [Rhodococcoides kyotonense]|uniref:Aryl-alcohol dehydrogenase n=1 Tax=Rhodococcoides kyotonense TaxID=398843 RepID=A0A177YJ35_9NOCA|nr:aryl-alcohol dehydrogenase [Rhodococcus kyotonensis]